MSFRWLYLTTLVIFFGSLLWIFLGISPEASQGYAQKIFFFHVPSAFVMYTALTLGAISSTIYLFDRKKIYDHAAYALMITATIFSGIVMASGPLWAKPIWGVFWTWDPRLTTTFISFILLLGYLFARALIEDNRRASVVGALLAIFALLDLPLIHFSVRLWRGIHPSVIQKSDGLPPSFRWGLELMTLSFFLLGALICFTFYRYLKVRSQWNKIRDQILLEKKLHAH